MHEKLLPEPGKTNKFAEDEEIMQTALNTSPSLTTGVLTLNSQENATSNPLNHYQIIRRNGAVVPFEPNKIAVAMMKAFLAVHGTQGAASASVREVVDSLTHTVV